jgi:hypothetical protein
MHENNFGRYACSKSLTDVLNKLGDKGLSRKMSAIYSKYRKHQKSLKLIKEQDAFVLFALTLRNWNLNIVDDLAFTISRRSNLSGEYSFAFQQFSNVIVTDHKELLRERGYIETPEKYKCL